MADPSIPTEPIPLGDEPLEAFYGDSGDEVERLAEAPGGGSEADGGGSEADGGDSGGGGTAGSGSRWRAPVTGALMAGIALGLRDVFEPEYHDRIAVEQPAPGQPLEPQKYEVHLDPVVPESSFAIYRPWLEDDDPDGPRAAPDDGGGTTGGGAGALGG